MSITKSRDESPLSIHNSKRKSKSPKSSLKIPKDETYGFTEKELNMLKKRFIFPNFLNY